MPSQHSKRAPLADRIRAYPVALQLKNNYGWGPKQIGEHLKLPSSTISNWLLGRFSPYRSCIVPKLDGSPSLSYLVGAFLGDGNSIRNSTYHYEVRLRVKDLDFAEHFSSSIAEVTGRSVHPKLDRRRVYSVRVWSRLLFDYLNNWTRMREAAKAYPAQFIKGFADAEGCVAVRIDRRRHQLGLNLVITNTDRPLLETIRSLLKTKFVIESTIRLDSRSKVRLNRLPCYYLVIGRRKDQSRFQRHVGFSISRKRERLRCVLRLLNEFGPTKALDEWDRLYEKRGRLWVNRS